jgi:prephenate dehydrogenase (NADP+)
MADNVEIGIIGLGDMGKLYARKFLQAGYTVNVCDLPSRYEELRESLKGMNFPVQPDGWT